MFWACLTHLSLILCRLPVTPWTQKTHTLLTYNPFLVSAVYPNTPVDKDPPPPEEPLSPEAFGKQDDRDLLLTIQQAPSQSFWYVDYYSVSNFILSQIVAAKEFLT